MPELPEVQTVVDDLNKKIKGYNVVDFWSDWKKTVKMPLAKYKKELIGRKIKKVERRGKNILIYLSSAEPLPSLPLRKGRESSREKVMLVHLKMTGHLLVKSEKLKVKSKYFNEKVNQYIHHIWKLKKGREERTLEFSDLRKFGKIDLFDLDELEKRKDIRELGVEPLSGEFTVEKLTEILKKHPARNVRGIIMDLKLIVGIGNIYASEIPFEAGISPKKKASRLNKEEIKRLHSQTRRILEKAIKMRGTSDSDYRDTDGAPGNFQKVLKVYGREGEKCKRRGCTGTIKREKMQQRSAFWCPKCQK